ncbi:hypothetical protein B7P43_G02035 [Cryptotermes secundus]|uniref:Tc1-like transposase DDE domain-containing protein n=1 Tax=Cryptotermes secundus TaxID=105785 RepID=A0A2J7Q903_9NEOP|nr:hypothetical protein B7P43_G02035 [Cryptotermes secundus]
MDPPLGIWMFGGVSVPPSKIAGLDDGGPIRWPPRSPDLTPLEFFLWCYVKDRVFVPPVNDLPDFRACIRETIATVPMDMLERTWQETEYRLDIVRATSGAHVEVY